MVDIYLENTNKDLEVENNDLKLTSDNSEYTSQTIETVLKRFKGEWWLNEDEGLPYYDSILVKNPNMDLINTLFKTEIIAIPTIAKIISFTSQFDNSLRQLSISFEVQLTNGEIIGSEGITL